MGFAINLPVGLYCGEVKDRLVAEGYAWRRPRPNRATGIMLPYKDLYKIRILLVSLSGINFRNPIGFIVLTLIVEVCFPLI